MKKIILMLLLLTSVCFGANEIHYFAAPGQTSLYCIVTQASTGNYWNGTAYVATPANWNLCDIAFTEDSFKAGFYKATMPTSTVGRYYFTVYQNASPVSTDAALSTWQDDWDGTQFITNTNTTKWLGTAVATPTVAGVPNVDMTYIGSSAYSDYLRPRTIATATVAADAAAGESSISVGVNTNIKAGDILTLPKSLGTFYYYQISAVTSDLNYSSLTLSSPLKISVATGITGTVYSGVPTNSALSTFDAATEKVIAKMTTPTGEPATWTDDQKLGGMFLRDFSKIYKNANKITLYDLSGSAISEQSYTTSMSVKPTETVNAAEAP